MFDIAPLRVLLMVVTGWLERRERDAIGYLIEENRLLRRQLDGRRLRLTGDGSPRWPTGSAVDSFVTSRRSQPPTPCYAGIDN